MPSNITSITLFFSKNKAENGLGKISKIIKQNFIYPVTQLVELLG